MVDTGRETPYLVASFPSAPARGVGPKGNPEGRGPPSPQQSIPKQEARMKRIPVFALALALLLAGCAGGGSSTPSPADTAKAHDAAVQAIKETESAWMTDINTKDVEKWLSYYTDDASVLVVNAPIATGKDAIRNMLKPMLSDPAFAIQFSASRVEVAGRRPHRHKSRHGGRRRRVDSAPLARPAEGSVPHRPRRLGMHCIPFCDM